MGWEAWSSAEISDLQKESTMSELRAFRHTWEIPMMLTELESAASQNTSNTTELCYSTSVQTVPVVIDLENSASKAPTHWSLPKLCNGGQISHIGSTSPPTWSGVWKEQPSPDAANDLILVPICEPEAKFSTISKYLTYVEILRSVKVFPEAPFHEESRTKKNTDACTRVFSYIDWNVIILC